MFKNINWDYAFGVVMGVITCKAVSNLRKQAYAAGFKDACHKCTEVVKEQLGEVNEKIQNEEKEEA